MGLLWWLRGKESTYNARDLGSKLGSGKFPGEGSGYPLQYLRLQRPKSETVFQCGCLGKKRVAK